VTGKFPGFPPYKYHPAYGIDLRKKTAPRRWQSTVRCTQPAESTTPIDCCNYYDYDYFMYLGAMKMMTRERCGYVGSCSNRCRASLRRSTNVCPSSTARAPVERPRPTAMQPRLPKNAVYRNYAYFPDDGRTNGMRLDGKIKHATRSEDIVVLDVVTFTH